MAANAVEVAADARVDLVGLIQILAENRKPPGPFDAAPAEFDRLRGHDAVKRYSGMTGFRGNLPIQYALYLSTDAGSEVHPVPPLFIDAAGGRGALTAFRRDLTAFASDADFLRWREKQGALLSVPVESLRRELAGKDLETPLLSYLGWRGWERWIIVPSPFPKPGASWILEEIEGLPLVYVILPPRWIGTEPVFPSGAELAEEIWSEPIFTAVYLICELCRPHLAGAARNCREEPETCVQKRIVDGVLRRLQLVTVPGAESRPTLGRAERRMDAALEAFEGRREEFPDLVSFRESLLAAVGGGEPPSCPLSQPHRLGEELFARRSAWYTQKAK